MEAQPSYYAVIPSTVRYCKDLKANEKLLYGEITALASAKGYCFASNSYFAELYGVSKVSISNWVSNLEKHGFIKTTLKYAEDSKQIVARYIYINDVPIKENFNTPQKEVKGGHKEIFNTPIKENFKDNITSINNTSINNSTTSDDSIEIQNVDQDRYKKVFNFYENNFGVVKASVINDLKDFLDIFKDPDMVIHAMTKAIDNNATFGYAKSIMQRWLTAKLMTLADVKADELAFSNRKSGYKRKSHHKEIVPEFMQNKTDTEVNITLDDKSLPSEDLELNETELRNKLNDLIGGF